MDMENAKEIAQLTRQIERSKTFLQALDSRGYNDEFSIYYRGGETCELEAEALYLLIDFYNNKKQEAEQKLESI